MKKYTYLVVLIFLISIGNLFAAEEAELVKQIHKIVPDVTKFEKHCILTAHTDRELKYCLDSQPKTQLYKYEQARRDDYIDTFSRFVLEKTPEDGRDPWYTFCVHHSTLLCFNHCLNGWVCPYD